MYSPYLPQVYPELTKYDSRQHPIITLALVLLSSDNPACDIMLSIFFVTKFKPVLETIVFLQVSFFQYRSHYCKWSLFSWYRTSCQDKPVTRAMLLKLPNASYSLLLFFHVKYLWSRVQKMGVCHTTAWLYILLRA